MSANLYDARNNEFLGSLDQILNNPVTDARVNAYVLNAANAEVWVDINGQSFLNLDVRTAAGVLTFVFEGTIDGVNYFGLPAFDVLTETYIAAVGVTTTLAKSYMVSATGWRRIRLRVSAYTSGNITVSGRLTRAYYIVYNRPVPAILAITGTAAANTGVTITLPAAGAGLFHYITRLEIMRNATAALAGTATLVITSTNLSGTLAWSVGNAMIAGGTQRDIDADFSHPVKSLVANTATTIVAPVPGLAVLWRLNAYYFVGA